MVFKVFVVSHFYSCYNIITLYRGGLSEHGM